MPLVSARLDGVFPRHLIQVLVCGPRRATTPYKYLYEVGAKPPHTTAPMKTSARQRHSRYGGLHLDHRRVRSALFDLLLRIAREDRLDQWAFAHMFNISQPRASDALHRRIEKFNSETLIDMLARLGVRLELHVAQRLPYKRWNLTRGMR